MISQEFLTSLISGTITLAVPLALAALGETLAERSGILNLGIEGMMAVGALTAFATSYYTGNPYLGLLCASVAGAALAAVHAFMTITLGVRQEVCGIGIALLGSGISIYLNRIFFGGAWPAERVHGLDAIPIPLLCQIPIIGPSLFNTNILVYLTIILTPLLAYILYKTTIGLKIRATGESPATADTLGVNVYRIRYLCVIFGGIMAGIAGAYLSTSQMRMFFEGMVAGRGWIALAIVIFGGWSPWKVFGASLFFGGVDAIQMRIQPIYPWFPYQILLMMPYISTIIVLILTAKKTSAPKALAIPYKRGK